MDPRLQTLVTSANSWFGHSIEPRTLALAYLQARATGSMPLTGAALQASVSDFPGFSDDMFLNVQLYQLCVNLGLPTDAQTTLATVRAALRGDGLMVDRETVQDVLQFATLRRLGAI